MRPGRPKQHTHNWKLKYYTKPTTGELWGRPDFWGWSKFAYMACIRGGRVKHVEKLHKNNLGGVFYAASGIMPEGWKTK